LICVKISVDQRSILPMSEQPYTNTPAEERYWNRYRLVQTLQSLAALWTAIALVSVVMGAAGFQRARAQADWPDVPGVIVASEIVDVIISSPAARQVKAVQIIYQFEVNGLPYESDRVNLNPVPVEVASEEGQRLLATYPVGANVPVYHDPDNPVDAVLEREPSPVGFIVGMVLAGMAAVVWLLAFVLGRELKEQSAHEPSTSDILR
jgi:hypothetical protein